MKKKKVVICTMIVVITSVLICMPLNKRPNKMKSIKKIVNIVTLDKFYKENRAVNKNMLASKIAENEEIAKVKAIKIGKGLIVDGKVGYKNEKGVFIVTDKWDKLTYTEKVRICKKTNKEINKIMGESIHLRFVDGYRKVVAESYNDNKNKFKIIK